MVFLLVVIACDGKLGESGAAATLPVCPEATFSSPGAVVGEGDIYEHCVSNWSCPERSSLDTWDLVEELRLASKKAGCSVYGEFDCGPVTKAEGCCYSFVISLSCGTVE